MAIEVFANNPVALVVSGGTDAPASGTQETWTVASSAAFPVAITGVTKFHVTDVVAPSEVILVTNTSGTTWTVTRGAEGSTPVPHAPGFTVYQVVTKGYLGLPPQWLNVIAFGADPTGVNDSTTAIQNAINSAVAALGGIVYFPAGTYKVSSTLTVNVSGVTLRGDDRWTTVIMYYGSSDCVRMYASIGYGNGLFVSGGGIEDLTIDGTHASNGACGAHIGDIYQLRFDFGVRFFKGTGSKGIWFDNQYFWCEDMYGHLFVEQNSTNLIFDNSANLNGQSTGSFARSNLTVVLDAKGFGDGLVLQNGVQYYGGTLNLLGNMDYSHTATQHWAVTVAAPAGFSYTATNASPCVFSAPGMYYGNGTNVFLTGAPAGFTNGQAYWVVNTNIGAGTFQLAATSGGSPIASTSTGSGTVNTFQPTTLQSSIVNINVECNGVNTNPQPGTINFTTIKGSGGYNNISQCTGIISFGATSVGFVHAVNSYDNFFFDGPVYGDFYLWRSMGLGNQLYFNGPLTSGQTIFADGVSTTVVDTTTPITGMQLQGGGGGLAGDSQFLTVLNAGTGSIQFANGSHVVNGTACIIPPNSAMTFQWFPSAFTWYPCLGAISPLKATGGVSTGTGTVATALSNGSTIVTSGITTVAVTNSGPVTGIIMGAGSTDGQLVWIINEGTGNITFDVAMTSNVADGSSDVIPANTARQFIWSSLTNLWYHTS